VNRSDFKDSLVSDKYGTLVSMGRDQNFNFKLTKSKESLRPIEEYKPALKALLS